ncbi:hypothetical protein ACFQ1E_13415 [Sphingomonas canadensis]|uniref:Uncharacterized protein n=1 Tax=Sphingomonas canadensis TaxID=1219257 RepID=A0ABW3H965_9SPHN|nr:hypothetical protein [Sphingomonas canadensis]MCW3837003.1 hypothetical protein [Sphingomonas canadensis]
MIGRNEMIAIGACVILTLAVFVGSTGLGYAIYRPLRDYDIFSLSFAWAGFAFYMWSAKRGGGR